jgi:4-hydroxy-3-polyprenylbenzoate decarboxylase
MPSTKTIVVGITGASGAAYAQKLLQLLEADGRVGRVHLVVSEAGQRLVAMELGIVATELKRMPQLLVPGTKKIDFLPNRDIGASIASGTYPVDGMVVVPCTTGALASIATGMSDDLIARAGDVCLKENRRLILCVRETPLSRIHLENMLRAQAAGAVIMPAVPAFYFVPKTIDDLVLQYVCRVLDHLDLPQDQASRWLGSQKKKKE